MVKRAWKLFINWIMGRYMVIEDDEGPTDPDIKPVFDLEWYGGSTTTRLPNGKVHQFGRDGWN